MELIAGVSLYYRVVIKPHEDLNARFFRVDSNLMPYELRWGKKKNSGRGYYRSKGNITFVSRATE